MAVLDPAGNHLWSHRYGDASDQVLSVIANAGMGSVVLSGYFSGELDFGGGPLLDMGGPDMFLAKLLVP
jgi:hypothetical protein